MAAMRLSYTFLIVVVVLLLLKGNVSADNVDCTTDGTCRNPDAVPDSIDLISIELPDPELPKGSNMNGTPREASKDCLDRHEQCIDFEAQGECDANPGNCFFFFSLILLC